MVSKTQLVIMRGLPASGKTTAAKAWVAKDDAKRIRVNRDELRVMLHDGYKGPHTERTVIRMRDAMIDDALSQGLDVVSDDTNLPAHTVKDLIKIANRYSAEVEVTDLTNVSAEECIRRNRRRKEAGERGVPDGVIEDMNKRFLSGKQPYPLPVPVISEVTAGTPGNLNREPYVPDPALPRAVIFDLDGTLAHMDGRSPYDYTKVSTDTLDEVCSEVLDFYRAHGYKILVVSGRKAECREDTVDWLHFNLGLDLEDNDYQLYMRASGDNRNDAVVKYEIFDRHIRPYYRVKCVFDDRDRVVKMWRSIGLKTLQVADGNF